MRILVHLTSETVVLDRHLDANDYIRGQGQNLVDQYLRRKLLVEADIHYWEVVNDIDVHEGQYREIVLYDDFDDEPEIGDDSYDEYDDHGHFWGYDEYH